MTIYIVTGASGSGKSLLAKRIAMSFPRYEYMLPTKNVFNGTFTPWISQLDCIVVDGLTQDDTIINGLLLQAIRTGVIPGIDAGCTLVLVYQELPIEFVGLENVFYVHTEITTD